MSSPLNTPVPRPSQPPPFTNPCGLHQSLLPLILTVPTICIQWPQMTATQLTPTNNPLQPSSKSLPLLPPVPQHHLFHCKNILANTLLESTMVTVATKWMGSLDLDGLNKTASRTAGRGLNTKQRANKQKNKWQSETNEARRARLLDT